MFLGCSTCSYVVLGLFLGCSACSWLVLGLFRLFLGCSGVFRLLVTTIPHINFSLISLCIMKLFEGFSTSAVFIVSKALSLDIIFTLRRQYFWTFLPVCLLAVAFFYHICFGLIHFIKFVELRSLLFVKKTFLVEGDSEGKHNNNKNHSCGILSISFSRFPIFNNWTIK